MKTNGKQELTNEHELFYFEADFSGESAIYFKMDSEEFRAENSIILEDSILDDPLSTYYWEENDEFGIYH
jgi:hypothetical protein